MSRDLLRDYWRVGELFNGAPCAGAIVLVVALSTLACVVLS